MQTEMSFLIDTNIIITAEPYAGAIEDLHSDVSSFFRLAAKHGHRICVHPASLDDLRETTDESHRVQNIAAYRKYAALTEVPVSPAVLEAFPQSIRGNDLRDARILSAFHAGAVDFLVTNDQKLRRRAISLGHELRILSAAEAAQQLAAWHPELPPPPPEVERVEPYELDTTQAIFAGLREDYGDFDGWIAKVKRDSHNRRCWIVRGEDGSYDALALVKTRDDHPDRPGEVAIKLCTFKVSDHAAGRRLGELLLKAVLRWAALEPGRPSELFVEVKSKQLRLLDFLTEFGFSSVGTKNEDLVYSKALDPYPGQDLDGLEHHIRFGPPAIRGGQPIYVIPIVPSFYESLFPDAIYMGSGGQTVLPGTATGIGAHGNAIRKAYLCRSQTRSIPPGSTLLFYRSQGGVAGDGAVVAVGVAEQALKSDDPVQTISRSFKRTVYSSDDVARLHAGGRAVLTILFRHDRFIEPPWSLSSLVSHKVISTWPQSIVRVRNGEGIAWVEKELNVWR